MSDHKASLAAQVRRLRETHGLSLAQLGERSGIAKATLFKIEQERTNPTLETLVAIADTFDVSVPELISTPTRAAVEVVRSGEGRDVSDDSSDGFLLRTQLVGAGTLEIHAQVFHADRVEVSPSHGTGAREHVLVRRGTIEVGPVGDEEILHEGDYATFSADTPHKWHAIGEEASVWMVCTYPRPASTGEHGGSSIGP